MSTAREGVIPAPGSSNSHLDLHVDASGVWGLVLPSPGSFKETDLASQAFSPGYFSVARFDFLSSLEVLGCSEESGGCAVTALESSSVSNSSVCSVSSPFSCF